MTEYALKGWWTAGPASQTRRGAHPFSREQGDFVWAAA
jgi:hypothetical protein